MTQSTGLREDVDMSKQQSEYDAVVIGGGHNGLINGAYLAKAGLRTLILERRDIVGALRSPRSSIRAFSSPRSHMRSANSDRRSSKSSNW